MKILQNGTADFHPPSCVCVRCEAGRDVEALERLVESLSPTDARPVRLVLTEEIVRLREKAGRA